jgi:hypothetical protein
MRSFSLCVLSLSACAGLTFTAPSARAAPPSSELVTKLAEHAEAFEHMRNHAGFLIDASLLELDGDGKTTSSMSGSARVDADGHATHVTVIRYVEDGKDETANAQKKAHEADTKRPKKADDERIHFPFLAREQSKYVFDQVESDPNDPSRVRITFVPKQPGTNSIDGSAWVDSSKGSILSAGFKLSRTPIFVDYIHVTVEFGAQTSMGAAVSRLTVDGGGGVLFLHRRFQGTASLTDYRIVP